MDGRATRSRPRIVIIGAGFGGLSAAKALERSPVDVVLIDRHNYHLFQPLLYQVATAGLSPADIAAPMRGVLRHQANATVVLAQATGIDVKAKEVVLDDGRIAYDQLIIATGARHAYFGRDEWERYAPGLKRIDDATTLRRRILLAFEKAENEPDEAERRRLLNFVVIGGGPTGVEMAGAIAELARKALSRDFRNIDPRQARIVLIESGPRVLGPFPEDLSQAAEGSLVELGVEVRLGKPVTVCDEDGVVVDGERLDARTIVWAAGVVASPAGKWIEAERDRAGRIKVNDDLSVPDHPEIFAIGDTACAMQNGKPLPGVAPVAKQQGVYVARAITARLAGKAASPFRYRDYGMMATIGRKRAVASLGGVHITGFIAWVIWSIAHVYYLIGYRNRLAVVLNWGWNYLTFQSGTRLITGYTGQLLDPLPAHEVVSAKFSSVIEDLAEKARVRLADPES